MVKFKFFVVILLLFSFNLSFAEDKDPIDLWLEKCLEKNLTTMGMLECTGKAYVIWDKRLNQVYRKLMSKLSPKQRKLLRESQRKWLQYRDKEFKFIENFYTGSGSMARILIAFDKLEFLKNRVKELEQYLSIVEKSLNRYD
ncbi:MAG: DUF1311 domain-containing protein [Persephonella sp.]|nr:MAG: DUF1311 domain-containing protein [Persephonella sp.]